MQEKLMNAIMLHQQGRLLEARAAYEAILKLYPQNSDTLHLLGVIAAQTGNTQRSIELISMAIGINPENAMYHNNLGNTFASLNRLEEAIASYERAISLQADYVEAHTNRGNALQALRRFDEAMTSYAHASRANPQYIEPQYNRGNVLMELNRPQDAIPCYKNVISIDPDYAPAHFNLGNALLKLKNHEEALDSYNNTIRLIPTSAEAHCNRGIALQSLKRLDAAIASYNQAININPLYAEAHYNLGNALQASRLLDKAIASYDQAIILKPDYAEAYSNRGVAAQSLGNLEMALENFDQAIKLKSNYAEAHFNRGSTLAALRRLVDAVRSFDQAILHKSDYAEAYNNRGSSLTELHEYAAAEHSHKMAVRYKPDYPSAYFNLGNALQSQNKFEEAITSYKSALELLPEFEYLPGTIFHTRMKVCDWRGFDSQCSHLIDGIIANKRMASSFTMLVVSDAPHVHRKAAEIWSADKHPYDASLGDITRRSRKQKIRIGYFSADFRQHPVSILLAGLFESHDKDSFELFAFSSGPDTSDPMRQRVKSAFHHFIDINQLSNKEAALLSRQHQIDIAIDLGGYTSDTRMGIFSYRAAPIQLSYIGYLGTMGAQYYDYLIADRTLIPEDAIKHYSEKIIYLPCYQVNDSKRQSSDRVFTKEEMNLPDNAFIYCCFNNPIKITPATFDSWMRILTAVPDSVLLLFADYTTAQNNLKNEARARGINPDRIIFGSSLAYSDHLARYRSMDLFLDTLPYNAGATASDALWAGLPVLTCMGESFASRYAASLLNAMESPELITHSQEDYEKLAIELATNPEKLNAIKERLVRNRQTSLLFDTRRFTRHLEAAYNQIHERQLAGLPPAHITINQ